MPAIARSVGMRIEHMTIPNKELLIERHIMSPKHLCNGGWILVESHVRIDKANAVRTQIVVVCFALGAKRTRLNDLMVISMPKTKWKYPKTNISAQLIS